MKFLRATKAITINRVSTAEQASDEKYSDDGIYFMVITKPNSPKIDDEWREKDKYIWMSAV